MGSIRVDSEEVWQSYVKEGVVKGFSIEGYFADKSERPKEGVSEKLAKKQINDIKDLFIEKNGKK
jgi:hypothetical protein